MKVAIPHILVVDDYPAIAESSLIGLLPPDAALLTVRHPRDITLDDLRTCAVVAVDHYLEDWSELDRQGLAMSPRDGFALAAVLRSHAIAEELGPAITILTAQLDKLAGALPQPSAEHLLAWQHDVEWVFSNSDPALGTRLLAMAEGVEALRAIWGPSVELVDLDFVASNWLALPDSDWRGVALDHVFHARPPIHALGSETNGSSFLRWFLQRIWPYPAFLTDIHWTATRIGVTANWLKAELIEDSQVSALLKNCSYTGAFSQFGGPRWWRAGIAEVVVEISKGQPFSRDALRAGLLQLSSEEPEFLMEKEPVVAVDPRSMEATRVVDASLAIQICPDGWPVYADALWATIEDVESDPELKDIVQDPSLLEPESET